MAFHELEGKIHQMVDDLQGLCSTVGLSNTANEEVVVTSQPVEKGHLLVAFFSY